MTYWVYENHVHDYAKVHRSDCSHCNDGRGTHGVVKSSAGRWLGRYATFREAEGAARATGKSEVTLCGVCTPG